MIAKFKIFFLNKIFFSTINSRKDFFGLNSYKMNNYDDVLNAIQVKIAECIEDRIMFTDFYNFILKEKEKNERIKYLNESDMIKFNVGGQIFSTLKSTLIKKIKKPGSFDYYPANLLSDIVTNKVNLRLDEQDAVFIDRDPKYFVYILNYIRTATSTNNVNAIGCSDEDKIELIKEAEYFKLDGLKDLLVSSLKNSSLINILDSTILSFDQMNSLMKLCNFPLTSKWRLLYRASRDSFISYKFHAKCDGKRNTLTVIKSSNGNIFGGYTEVAWSQNEHFGHDENAFIFSLVNKDNRPILMKCTNPENAIFCRKGRGPTFGTSDILISNRSNTNERSVSNLGWAYKHPIYARSSTEAREFLAGSNQFKTLEVEVFCLE